MADDQLVENVVIERLSVDQPQEKVQEIFEACKNVKGSTSCETAFKVYECYLSNSSWFMLNK